MSQQCSYSKLKNTYPVMEPFTVGKEESYGSYVNSDATHHKTLGQLTVKEGFVNQTAHGDNTQRAVHVSEQNYATLKSMSSCPMETPVREPFTVGKEEYYGSYVNN
jgi:hypothetical protein